MAILLLAEHDRNTISKATQSALAAALQIDDDVHLLLTGYQLETVTSEAKKLPSISKILCIDSKCLTEHLPEALEAAILPLVKNYSHIIIGATTYGKNLAPRIAAKLDVAQISDVIRVIDKTTYQRPVYAGNAIATIKSHDKQQVLTIRATAFKAITDQNQKDTVVENILYESKNNLSTFVQFQATQSDRPELNTASIVVSGGRALGSAEQYNQLLGPLAHKLGAALGATRAAVDAGFAPNECQVGQTGKIVAPSFYFAIGISGAIQHLAGMKESKIIIAINKDPEAPIFKVADYGIVGDLFTIVPKLTAELP